MSSLDQAFDIAEKFYRADRLAAAEQIYRAILKTAFEPAALHNLSVVLFRQGKKPEALRYLMFALQVSDIFPELLGTLLAFLEDPECAPPPNPGATALQLRATMMFRLGLKRDAVKLLQEAVAQHPAPDLLRQMIEFLSDPACAAQIRDPLGGPFNGQRIRQSIFSDIVRLTRPVRIFETGTFLGSTTEFMASQSEAHVFSCELRAYNYRFAARRLASVANVSLVNLDSRAFLGKFVPCYGRGEAVTLFYLDAHWEDDLPLLDEISVIIANVRRPIVIVDDFEVWDDPGYSFDDYGPGKALTLGYLAPLGNALGHRFFPSGSGGETGGKRGCLVMTSDDALAAQLGQIEHLRPAPARD